MICDILYSPVCLKFSDKCPGEIYNKTWARRLVNVSYSWDSTRIECGGLAKVCEPNPQLFLWAIQKQILYSPEKKPTLKVTPRPSSTSKFLHRYFYLVYKPHLYTAKTALSAKVNAWWLTRILLFVVWTVYLLHLLLLDVIAKACK